MKGYWKILSVFAAAVCGAAAVFAFAAITYAEECFESREGYSRVETKIVEGDKLNVKCSGVTGGVLWWGDPYDNTQPMGEMPANIDADYLKEEAVVRPRTEQMAYYPCSNCHGAAVPVPKDKRPRLLNFHQDIVPNSLELKHGKGAIWCFDCHNPTNRDTFITHNGVNIDFNQPQKLCGKCHGDIYRDWRDGIHGKRTGMWTKGGKKRWWTCAECHNPHDMEPKFKPLKPEPPPTLPKGMQSAEHERREGH